VLYCVTVLTELNRDASSVAVQFARTECWERTGGSATRLISFPFISQSVRNEFNLVHFCRFVRAGLNCRTPLLRFVVHLSYNLLQQHVVQINPQLIEEIWRTLCSTATIGCGFVVQNVVQLFHIK